MSVHVNFVHEIAMHRLNSDLCVDLDEGGHALGSTFRWGFLMSCRKTPALNGSCIALCSWRTRWCETCQSLLNSPSSTSFLPPPPPESLACFSRNMKGPRAVYSPQISGVGPSELSLFSPRVMTVKIAKNKTKACTYKTTLNCQSARRKWRGSFKVCHHNGIESKGLLYQQRLGILLLPVTWGRGDIWFGVATTAQRMLHTFCSVCPAQFVTAVP